MHPGVREHSYCREYMTFLDEAGGANKLHVNVSLNKDKSDFFTYIYNGTRSRSKQQNTKWGGELTILQEMDVELSPVDPSRRIVIFFPTF